MIAGNRLPLLTFGVSMFFHVIFIMGLPRLTWLNSSPDMSHVTKYVMRFQPPAPTLTPTPTPTALNAPTSIEPAPVESTEQPQAPKPIERVQVKAAPTPIPDVMPEPAKPMPLPTPDVPVHRPFKPKKRAVVRDQLSKPKVATIKPKARQPVRVDPLPPRRPSKPAQSRQPQTVVPKQAPTRAAEMTPRSVPSVPTQVANLAPPRQPIGHEGRAEPSQSQTNHTDPNALKAYLNLILQVLEKHKRYPKAAKRLAMNGKVVLQFVILPDGQVINPQITQSSGHRLFRTAALQALSRVGQMPPFPSDMRRRKLLVEVPISYQIKNR